MRALARQLVASRRSTENAGRRINRDRTKDCVEISRRDFDRALSRRQFRVSKPARTKPGKAAGRASKASKPSRRRGLLLAAAATVAVSSCLAPARLVAEEPASWRIVMRHFVGDTVEFLGAGAWKLLSMALDAAQKVE
ncbi:hypothetical protein NKR23_g6002 [Pleurostoma richardsiae]|uniref:Uncharacterized protein n=1 Tax=Pleurostoma richardsiae TaxID=41990 RepID=A0AA38VIC8_9PEZI|nr:hypothetical protein NKR23_g6002 [Pleurostoma richardsiae]